MSRRTDRSSERVQQRLIAAVLLALCLGACKASSPRDEQAKTEQAPGEPKGAATKPQGTRPGSGQGETVDGYRVVRARTKSGETTSLRVKPPKGWTVMAAPTSPDPHGGEFGLDQATKGLAEKGDLAAKIETSMGTLYCELFADKAPNTVANFVGLARGLRKYWDAEALEWVARRHYDGTTFHRVIPGFMIQGGDRAGTGKGQIGYAIDDELHPSLEHDRGGQLCMANRGPDTNQAQFFITEAAAPHLNGSYTIFGQCAPLGLVYRIARVPQKAQNQPVTPVTIERVEIKRLVGGARKWMPEGAEREYPMPDLAPPGRAVQVE